MTTLTSEIKQQAPFIGLESYSESQADIFFGRDKEIHDLEMLIKLNTLTLLFGKSGTGKTSLLNAGVFPALKQESFLPFRITFDLRNNPDLISQVKKVLQGKIDEYKFNTSTDLSTFTLWEYFHIEPLWQIVTPILVFDQFEEMFTRAEKGSHFEAFWTEISDLIENFIPLKLRDKFLNERELIDYNYKAQKVKIVFSFREEFLPEFETKAAKIPSIKQSRFRLMPMNGIQALEVIEKTWQDKIDDPEARSIVTYFTNETVDDNFEMIVVEPSLLSQVCTHLEKDRIKDGSDKISSEFLEKHPKETLLSSIYNDAIIEANAAIKPPGNEA